MRSKQAPAAAPARNPPSPRPQPRAAPALTPTAEGPGNLQLAQSAAMGLVSPLRPGPPNAPEEHAARRFARDIMTAPTRGPCACGGTCPACRGRSGAAGARALGRNPAPLKGGSWPFGPMAGRPLDMASRRWFEDRLQGPLGPVLVHDDPQTADHARAMGARAFAVGNRIGFARDQYRPSTPSGRAILAHEIAHVALGHQGLRRDGFDDGLSDAEIDAQIEQGRALAKEKEQERAKHQAWTEGVVKRWPTDLGEQSKDLASERERLSLGLSAAQAKAFDAANEGAGWLADALKKQGYDGPSIVDVKQMWAQALVAADAIKLSANAPAKEEGKPTLSADTKLAALSAVSTYFNGAKKFSEAAEAAHLKYTTEENARLTAQYDKEYADYLEGLDTAGNLMVGVPVSGPRMPKKPTLIVAPPPVSGTFSGHITRLEKAGSPAEWEAVAENVRTSASAVAKLVVASLPAKSAVVAQVSGIEALDARLKKYADSHTLFRRIPAVFYPKDATSTHTDAAGNRSSSRTPSRGNSISATERNSCRTSGCAPRSANGC